MALTRNLLVKNPTLVSLLSTCRFNVGKNKADTFVSILGQDITSDLEVALENTMGALRGYIKLSSGNFIIKNVECYQLEAWINHAKEEYAQTIRSQLKKTIKVDVTYEMNSNSVVVSSDMLRLVSNWSKHASLHINFRMLHNVHCRAREIAVKYPDLAYIEANSHKKVLEMHDWSLGLPTTVEQVAECNEVLSEIETSISSIQQKYNKVVELLEEYGVNYSNLSVGKSQYSLLVSGRMKKSQIAQAKSDAHRWSNIKVPA